MDLDRELAIREGHWRGRLLTFGMLAVAAVVAGVVAYAFFFRDSSEQARPTEDLVVGRATINANLLVSGVADAQLISDLSFRTSGRVEAINVHVGDTVQQGDVLAALESDDLANGVASAQANLALAQARFDELVEGATDAQRAAADQSVVNAEVNRDRSIRDVDDLLDPPDDVELTSDEQAVVVAESALAQAQRDRTDLLNGPTAAQIASASQVIVSAQTALAQAERDRTTLLAGPSATDLATTDQAVSAARATLNQAERALADLRAGPTAAQLAAAEQAVAAARAGLTSAQAALDRLREGATSAQLAAAEAQVASAEQALFNADSARDSARTNRTSAEGALRAAQGAYCAADPLDSVCASSSIPLSTASVDHLVARLGDPTTSPALFDLITTLIQRNAAYETALNAENAAEHGVDAAEAALDAAEANLAALRAGPEDRDVRAAEAAVDAARQSLTLAELRLANVRAGAEQSDLDNAQDAVTVARAALDAALSRQADLRDGPDSDDVDEATDRVRSAQAVLDAATAQYNDLIEPPDADDIARADDAVRSAEAALAAAGARHNDLLDGADDSNLAGARDAIRAAAANLAAAVASQLEIERGPREVQIEQQRQSVRAAELAVEAARIHLRDAQIISPFEGTVAAVNLDLGEFTGVGAATPAIVLLTPDVLVLELQLGETDYPNVKLDQVGVVLFDAIPGTPYAFTVLELGLSPTVTQGVVTYHVTAALNIPPDAQRPAPGMSASGQIVTESRANVVAVPPRAIRRRGTEQVVDVRRNGTVVEQVVTTGFSDTNNVEILTGLEEGDVIVVPTLVTGSADQPDVEPTLPSGIR